VSLPSRAPRAAGAEAKEETAVNLRFHACLAIASLAVPLALSGCAPSPRTRPLQLGAPNQGPGSVTEVRRQLQGAWDLVEFDRVDGSGKASPFTAKGRLTFDDYGNLTIQGVVSGTGSAESDAAAGQSLAFNARVVIDPATSTLRVADVRGNEAAVPAAISPDKVRYYQFADNLLKITIKDAAGKPTTITTWKKGG
jgi:hypothetical protein